MPYQPAKEVICEVCGRPAVARRLCRRHYSYAQSHGDLGKYPKLGPEDVFDSRYKITSAGCWEWTGSRNTYGYGVLLLPGSNKHTRAHRYAYERAHGPIPKGLVIMHTCDNPPCVNPEHLQLGTRRDNNWDATVKGRRPSGNRHWSKAGVKFSQGRGKR